MLVSGSLARISTIGDVMILRYTGCWNSKRIPRPTNRIFSIEPPQVDPSILTGTGSGQYFGYPQVLQSSIVASALEPIPDG